MDDLAGVGVVDAHRGHVAVRRRHQSLVHREGADGRRHVAAVAAVVDLRLPHLDLGEGVVHVGAGNGRRPYDADLGQRGHAAAHAVQLPAVAVWRAHGAQEDRVPCGAVGREVAQVEDQRLAGATADEGRLELLCHARLQ